MGKIILDVIQKTWTRPSDKLFNSVVSVLHLDDSTSFRITRIGGQGLNKEIIEYENQLETDGTLVLDVAKLRLLVGKVENQFDWLICVSPSVAFGVFDSSYLFVQCDDKVAESRIAQDFSNVEETSDVEDLA